MNACTHILFQYYPLTGKATIATGEVSTPYHIYDGYGALIGGAADLAVTGIGTNAPSTAI